MNTEIREAMKIANADIKLTNIGKSDYAEVPQRVNAFRKVHPLGCITTEIISLENGVVVMKATITSDDGVVLATGYAYEKENSTFINKTSFIENCETSAVGRALGFCGFGIDKSIASAEEVANAKANQEPKEKVEKTGDYGIADRLRELYSEDEQKKIMAHYKVRKLENLPKDVSIKYITDRSKSEKLDVNEPVKDFY